MPDRFLLLFAHIEPLKTELLTAAAEQTQADRFAVHRWNRRNANVDLLITRLQIHAPVLRQSPLGDVHVRHHFQSRNDRRVQQAQLRGHRDFVQDPVDPVTNANVALERLDMNIGRALHDRFANNLVHEFHHRRFRIVRADVGCGFAFLQNFEVALRFENLVERFRANAVERFHRAEELPARHQHPFGRLFQKLAGELTT